MLSPKFPMAIGIAAPFTVMERDIEAPDAFSDSAKCEIPQTHPGQRGRLVPTPRPLAAHLPDPASSP